MKNKGQPYFGVGVREYFLNELGPKWTTLRFGGPVPTAVDAEKIVKSVRRVQREHGTV